MTLIDQIYELLSDGEDRDNQSVRFRVALQMIVSASSKTLPTFL